MLESPSLITTIFAFALVLGPLVMIHELGHYLVGRWFGVKADAFSIGFGREIAGWTDRRGTRWKLSVLPLGGYVQFAGDMNAASAPAGIDDGLSEEERRQVFQYKPLWQRSLIVLAGPLTNLLFAVAIFAAFNMIYGEMVASPRVASFAAQSTAEAAGLKVGDRILAVDGEKISSFTDIPPMVVPFPGRTINITVRRDDRELTYPVKIASVVEHDGFGNEARVGRLGVGAGDIEVQDLNLVQAVGLAVDQSAGVMGMMATGIGQILSGERSIEELGGPVKIAKYSGEQFSLGWAQFVSFVALISINLAFINILPIPALDGGHLAFYAAEAVRRKPLDLRSQEWAIRTGLALVLALMVFVTFNDLTTLSIFGG